LSLSGWQPILVNKTSRTHKNSVSRHAQFYVSQMLEFIAAHYDQALTVNAVAEHEAQPNYAMGVFQRVMQQTMKQYITAMRINHVRALLSDTDKTILDIALTAGFRSSSRFYSTFTRTWACRRSSTVNLASSVVTACRRRGIKMPPGKPRRHD
jgi:AraC-like DNA-binding protein